MSRTGRSVAQHERRGQTNLPVLAIALVVLTAVTGMTVVMAEGAYLSAERDASERGIAVAAADRFVAGDASHTSRANVLDAAAIEEFTPADLAGLAPATADTDVRIRVGEETILERGDPDAGTTVRRIALVAEPTTWRGTTTTATDGLTVPHRTGAVRLNVIEGHVHTVRVGDRVVAHDPDGIDRAGEPLRVETSRHEPVRLSADGDGGSVAVESVREETESVVVAVTVDE